MKTRPQYLSALLVAVLALGAYMIPPKVRAVEQLESPDGKQHAYLLSEAEMNQIGLVLEDAGARIEGLQRENAKLKLALKNGCI